MSTPEVSPRGGRETRLLLVTIAISVGVLLLLARFRFPEDPASRPIESAPAPLERLAARAAYDELASIMADLERRVAPRITIVRTQSGDGRSGVSVAPRLLPDRAVAIVPPGDSVIAAGTGGDQEVISLSGSLAILRVAAIDDSAVPIRQLPLRSGPRYVGVVEASAIGFALTPLYVGRIDAFDDPVTGSPLLSLAGLQRQVPRGAAIFSLEGLFLGLVRDSADTLTVIPAEALRASAQAAQPSPASAPASLGVEVDVLTAALGRATGAEHGVVVVHVRPGGAAEKILRSGDVIQSIDGTQIATPIQFREAERNRAPGAEVAIVGVRLHQPLQVSVKAANATAAAGPSDDPGLVGRTVAGLGVEVVAVREGSAADRAGLRRGDVITAIDEDTTADTAGVERRFRAAQPDTTFLLTVRRDQRYRVLPLEKR
jgi:membrane-associated protease RseP (regulator of RpoE activity)